MIHESKVLIDQIFLCQGYRFH